MMVNELISRVFEARNVAHLEHWATDSFSFHLASGDFYDKSIDLLDDFIETYQGAFGKVEGVKLSSSNSTSLVPLLSEQVIWLNKNHEAICRGISALENLLDNLADLYLKTLYKLKELK